MFKRVRLSNFKSFEGQHQLDLRRLSVFIGPNGSGKSSVLQALLLLRQSRGKNNLQLDGPSIDLGGTADLE